MAIHPYNKIYLSDLADTLGIMFEHATNIGIKANAFWSKFINSNVAKKIENGNPKYLSCSALDYLIEIYERERRISKKEKITKNEYYWAGWILAQFQYLTGYPFYKINRYLPIEEVLRLYPTLHEADVNKFFDVAKTYFKKPEIINLKRLRQALGLSQNELAKLANVDLRSIQMYEQKINDINKAQADTLYRLSKVLGCDIEDLLEEYI